MQFYTIRHRYYCGVDLHARSLYVCILDSDGKILVHRPIPADPERLLKLLEPYRDDVVVGVECMFCWYWVADLCEDNGIPFVLGHALYMKAVHGGKAKNDKIDSKKIAHLLLGCTFPQAYVYPRALRATRDLLRRRMYFVRHRAELVTHIQNTASQYNLAPCPGRLSRRGAWDGVVEHFPQGPVQETVQADLATIQHLSGLVAHLEWSIEKATRSVRYAELSLLRSIHGIGRVLALTILHEIHSLDRFPRVQQFLSYSRLVACAHVSAGKIKGVGGRKIGNAHLTWAFSEAAVLFIRGNPRAQKLIARLERKHGKGRALSILARRLASAVYFMLKRKEVFDEERFLAA
jgi:transposase